MQEDDLVQVCLAGMYAESLEAPSLEVNPVEEFFDTYIAAGGDRAILYEAAKSTWLKQKHSVNWPRIIHNKAKVLVQKNRNVIEGIVNALSTKEGYPKVLEGEELRRLLAQCG
jgi:hypothetical protein